MRVAVALWILAAVCFVAGTALFSLRVAVLVVGACLAVAAVLQVEVKP